MKRSKRRSNKNGLINFIFLVLIMVSIFSIFSNVNARKYYDKKKIVVHENDTIWSIAQNICDKNEDLNVYKVIKDIKKLNDLDSSIIYPDQVMYIYEY